MKKLTTMMMMLLFAATTFTLTSCDEDDDIAYTLEGTWQGNMYVTSTWNGVTYDATRTEICFLRDPYRYSSGDGYWVDYYSRAPWDYVANHIRWTVNNGVIRVYLIEDDWTYDIYDYRLSDNYFTGTIYDGDNAIDFRLRHISSPNWNDFDWGYDYWYGAKSHSKAFGSRSTDKNATEKPVRGLKVPAKQ